MNDRVIIYGVYSYILKQYICYFQHENDCIEYVKTYLKDGLYLEDKRVLIINSNRVLSIHDIVLL